MRIDPRWAGPASAGAAKAGQSTGRPTFRVASEGSGGATQARAAAPLATLDAILMLQGGDDSRERRRRSARRGQDLLAGLDGLKAALLSGTVPIAALRTLSSRVAAAAADSGDPGLDEVVAAIELRAKVELAKLGMV
ncbi:flagellar assembly protein FliX [uncultured Enterovirga sp.]|uniref:flagellar assembly protein FliX n=1 Tax=uncultured Enterovirga sp. TaxID=2026352 RepID=UPI0035CC2C60